MRNMPWDLVTIDHEGSSLHGLHARPDDPKGLLVHVHGTWGNFYGNAFVASVAERAVEQGWSFATINVPGHDETAMDESIAEFVPALREWLTVLNPRRLPVVLEGHSLGALKAIDLLSDTSSTSEFGIIATFLLSAFDCVGFYSRESALGTVDQVGISDSSIVPEEVFPHWLLRWKTLRELSMNNGQWDLFKSRHSDPSALLERDALPVPAFFAIGSEDFAAVPSPASVVASVQASGMFERVEYITGAPHGFNGHEDELAEVVAGWLGSLDT